MSINLSLLYRGPLSSCNYDCHYCPFAKHNETAAESEKDRNALERFVNWCIGRTQDQLSVFFTPWGEALIRHRYQRAIVQLTQCEQLQKVAIQTNLSCGLQWTDLCDKQKLALWCTFHPSQITRQKFISRCRQLDERGIRYSVGAVGLREDISEIERLRNDLPPNVYLWINAYKRETDDYSAVDFERLEAVDPLFRLNTKYHASLGRRCRTGNSVISVDGEGTITRCHFIKEPLGNLYDPDFESVLKDRLCTNQSCGCHIGYVHLEELQLDKVFGDGVLERIPREKLSV